MKKLLAMMLIAILATAVSVNAQAQSTTIMGVPIDLPSNEFSAQINTKSTDIANIAKAKKCKIEVNKNVPGNPTAICYVDIELDYKATESNTAFAMLRSLLNEKYGENNEGTVMLSIPIKGLFWKTPCGEVALYKVSDTVSIRVFNYKSIKDSFNGVSNLF